MIVYLITNTISGKRYVGASSHTLPQRWARHKIKARSGSTSPLHIAVRGDGYEAFSMRVLSEVANAEVLNKIEAFWIRELGTLTPSGYNLSPGGSGRGAGWKHYSETRNKIGDANSGKTPSLETRAKMSRSARGHKNAAGKRSPEQIARIKAGRWGKNV
jgi:group I intron endonuclease